MRLTEYIMEDDGVKYYMGVQDGELYHNFIEKNCKQYLRLLKGRAPFYRGMKGNDHFGIKNVRKDRQPFGMAPQEAEILNKWLQKHGHARRDQSVMCTSDYEHTDTFGRAYMIFPLDPIKKFTWFNSKDMNMDGDYGWEWNTIPAWVAKQNGNIDRVQQELLDNLKMPFEDFFTTNKQLDVAYNNGYEVWFDCEKYYFLQA